MKKLFFILLIGALTSCGVKVPYTNEVRDQFGLDDPKQARKVQFYTSATIILQKSKSAGGQGTSDSGVLVSSSSSEENRIIIPVNTKCVFEGFGEGGEVIIRFETGPGKTLTFAARPGQQTSKYYIVANWSGGKGGELKYQNYQSLLQWVQRGDILWTPKTIFNLHLAVDPFLAKTKLTIRSKILLKSLNMRIIGT